MPSPSESGVTTVVIEVEPGLVYVKIIDPKPDPERIEFFLRRTIDDWSDASPHFVIDRTETLTDYGVIQGIHVWYHVDVYQPERKNPMGRQPTPLTVEVDEGVSKRFSKEYVEAVLDDVMQIRRDSPDDRADTLVVINPRRVAVILDRQANRGAVLPAESVERVMDGPTRERFQTWLGSPTTRFYLIHVPGSWFVAREVETQRSKILDPPPMRTNMTYDTGPRRVN